MTVLRDTDSRTRTEPSGQQTARCQHGVEAGSYCAKCGKEIVRGPLIGPRTEPAAKKETALALRDQGRSARQIAVELSLPLSTVGEWIANERRTNGYQPRGRQRYKVTGVAQKKGKTPSTYKITVPSRIGDLIPPDMEFMPELTEDGILFRIATASPEPDLPSWVTEA